MVVRDLITAHLNLRCGTRAVADGSSATGQDHRTLIPGTGAQPDRDGRAARCFARQPGAMNAAAITARARPRPHAPRGRAAARMPPSPHQ